MIKLKNAEGEITLVNLNQAMTVVPYRSVSHPTANSWIVFGDNNYAVIVETVDEIHELWTRYLRFMNGVEELVSGGVKEWQETYELR